MMTKHKLFLSAAAVAAAAAITTPAQAQDNTPLLSEVQIYANSFCPRGFAETFNQLLPISSNAALFSLVGTMYGGDGRTTFALPDTRARTVVGVGQGPGLSDFVQGETGGRQTVTLLLSNLPSHTHTGHLVAANSTPGSNAPGGGALANFGTSIYVQAPAPTATVNMIPGSVQVGTAGGSQPANIVNPYLALRYCIATQGVFPSRN